MTTLPHKPWHSRLDGIISESEVRLSLLTAALLLLEAVLAKNVLDVRLDFISQSVAMWIFIVFMISGERGRAAELATAAAMIVATVAVLTWYAI